MDTPLSRGDHIPLTEEEEEFMADKYEQYGHVVGMLGALMLSTRPDLAYCVGQVRQYTAFPRRHYYQALKRIVRYFKGTTSYGLVRQRRTLRAFSATSMPTTPRTLTTGPAFQAWVLYIWELLLFTGARSREGRSRGGLERGRQRKTDRRE
jgi:hypothetical protein